jgi:hypothetical protein
MDKNQCFIDSVVVSLQFFRCPVQKVLQVVVLDGTGQSGQGFGLRR